MAEPFAFDVLGEMFAHRKLRQRFNADFVHDTSNLGDTRFADTRLIDYYRRPRGAYGAYDVPG
jgi:hypothetical protein